MSAPPQIQGTIRLGEANATAPDLRSRIGGATWIHQFVLVIIVAIAAVAGWEWQGIAGAILGLMLADLSYNFVGARLIRADYRRRWAEAGQQTELPISLIIQDVALISKIAEVTSTIGWSAVTELFRSKGYWIFVVHGDAIYAPSRLFETSEEERAFIAAALSRMSEGARNRSLGAVTYVAGG